MKILFVIHGYPMRYNAGSEVYTQALAQALARKHEVHVFTREENPFVPDFELSRETDPDNERVRLWLVNNPRNKDRYREQGIDQRFAQVLDQVHPDTVHVNHLNHLSTSIVQVARDFGVPVVFTLHDYWLMCPRGQFMQMFPEDRSDPWAVCEGQEDRKCAERCYARYYSGAPEDTVTDVEYWTDWVHRRMAHVREMTGLVDLLIAPARYLRGRFVQDFGIPAERIQYLDYGFHHDRLSGRKRESEDAFVLGYIGTHIPAKGVKLLIEAFGAVQGKALLRIWGRERGQETASLKRVAASLPDGAGTRIQWMGEYRNQDIVPNVFNRCDAIVVPSIWAENSPLVIHEAQQAWVPVITADFGGMAEYVHHESNGLQFRHRDVDSLAVQMQRFVDRPDLAAELGSRGYLHSEDGNVPEMNAHAEEHVRIYREVLDASR